MTIEGWMNYWILFMVLNDTDTNLHGYWLQSESFLSSHTSIGVRVESER